MIHSLRNGRLSISIALLVLAASPVQEPALRAAQNDALAISQNIQQLHLPYGTILDPLFASPASTSLVGYSRCGDSAIWTGHYLAAEAFRYAATGSPDALNQVEHALRGLRSLLDVTGTEVLARCLIPADSPYLGAILQGEAHHPAFTGILGGRTYFWVGGTSRDQYSGVMFGLSLAYHLIPSLRSSVRTDVTRILDYLLREGWNVVMPDGSVSTTFLLRPDQQLAFLQIGRRINPQRFALRYAVYRATYAATVILPILYDNIDDNSSYFKFNLNYINLFSLVGLEESSSSARRRYLDAYNALRDRTQHHGNPHFNMVDRALRQPELVRDAETRLLLDLWLQRSRRDFFVDLRGRYPECGPNRACEPIPVPERVNTDFLWQRTPFELVGGGDGTIETAGIDYILPYWMARYYGVL
jgi:hypothetical protein